MEERRKTREKKKGGDRRRRRTFTGTRKGWRVRGQTHRERERERSGRVAGPLKSIEGSRKERSPLVGRASRFLDFRVFSNSRSENSGAGRFPAERVNVRGGGKRDREGGEGGNRISLLCEPFQSVARLNEEGPGGGGGGEDVPFNGEKRKRSEGM